MRLSSLRFRGKEIELFKLFHDTNSFRVQLKYYDPFGYFALWGSRRKLILLSLKLERRVFQSRELLACYKTVNLSSLFTALPYRRLQKGLRFFSSLFFLFFLKFIVQHTNNSQKKFDTQSIYLDAQTA